ncbi:MAG: AbrB/MazE/SpoVT family DNA-binding domain-containing protein [Anaerolineales bacterium]|nr:AbrB/MazE/SpoVT family DNA-binding domain-containing protein [Anaerolineales bacterium]
MVQKVFKTGNSIVVSIPKELLEQIRMTEGTDVSVELDRQNAQIVIRPTMPIVAEVDEKFAHQLDQFINQYRSALEKLAERPSSSQSRSCLSIHV